MREVDLGIFEVESGKLVISDPCYARGTWCQGELKDVQNGKWKAKVIKSDEGSWGNRCAELIAEHPDAINASRFWDKENIDVGVDSGQAGIFDSDHFECDSDAGNPKHDFGEPWYNMCCDITLGDLGAGVIPFGVVSSSGFGDGSYDCFTRKKDGKTVAVKIIFITEEDDEDGNW